MADDSSGSAAHPRRRNGSAAWTSRRRIVGFTIEVCVRALGNMAERQGFEPWSHLSVTTRSPSVRFQPLSNLSNV